MIADKEFECRYWKKESVFHYNFFFFFIRQHKRTPQKCAYICFLILFTLKLRSWMRATGGVVEDCEPPASGVFPVIIRMVKIPPHPAAFPLKTRSCSKVKKKQKNNKNRAACSLCRNLFIRTNEETFSSFLEGKPRYWAVMQSSSV